MIGTTISHYKITEKLGEGGMGVVYKADDTKLDRPVALKFLATHLISDQEVRKRFEREAKAAAALNHPNICHVYEIDEVEGKTFIAMAFLDGAPLDKKIEAGPLKLKDALDVAIQSAKGLQAAHGKGIVHRDIKPANLMIGEDGQVTIMDFGLAQLADRSKLTRMDETMGTVTYMSPEQTYGVELDHRTDVWSLGVVIYEMVTGQQAFKGHYDKAVMYSITNEEPEPMTALRTGVPMALELLVNKCLAKGAERRYQSAAELVVDLETLSDKLKSGKSTVMHAASAGSVGARHAVPAASRQTGGTRAQHAVPLHSGIEVSEHPLAKYRVIENLEEQDEGVVYRAEDTELHRSVAIRVLPESAVQKITKRQRVRQAAWLAVTLGLLIAVAVLWFRPRETAPELPLRKFSFVPDLSNVADPVISPNGRHIAFLGAGADAGRARQLWVLDLDGEEPRRLSEQAWSPFWSPDSKFVGFLAADELKKVSVQGGAPTKLCAVMESLLFFSAGWSQDGRFIAFSAGVPPSIYEVSSQGGSPKLLAAFMPKEDERWGIGEPYFLPGAGGSERFLYFRLSYPVGRIFAYDAQTGHDEFVVEGSGPVYSPTGHILYEPPGRGSVWAVPFSLEALAVTGEPFPVRADAREPSVSRDGTLVYLLPGGTNLRTLVWRPRDGSPAQAVGSPQAGLSMPSLSPDGTKAVAIAREESIRKVWVYDLERGVGRPLTFDDAEEDRPLWLPNGQEISFAALGDRGFDIHVTSADGRGAPRELFATPFVEFPHDWSPDGKYLVIDQPHPGTNMDIYYVRFDSGTDRPEAVPFVNTRHDELAPDLSPDGRFLAYESDESGGYEIYIQRFPEGGGKAVVSAGGGRQPRWRGDGKELYYVNGDTMMAVTVSADPALRVGRPSALFEAPDAFSGRSQRYDVTADGQRFLYTESVGEGKPSEIRVVQNWFAEFKDRQ